MSDQLDFELRLGAAVKVFATNVDGAFDATQVASAALRTRYGWPIGRWISGQPRPDLLRAAAAVGAVALLAATAVYTFNFLINLSGFTGPAPTASPTPSPIETPSPVPTTSPVNTPATSGGMWPQTTLEEVQAAQQRADRGDPDYTWQVDPGLTDAMDPSEIVQRFLRDKLGWNQFIFNRFEPKVYTTEEGVYQAAFLRCSPTQRNDLYPGESCAPTIDDSHYESVLVDVKQPGTQGSTGIWVVNHWQITPFTQADPDVVETDATARLEEFLDARLAGEGADGYVDFAPRAGLFAGKDVVPLLYRASTGSPYERYQIDVVDGPSWPHGDLAFNVRLFADGGDTVVEQPFAWQDSSLFHDRLETKENGQPVDLPFQFLDGEVTLTAASPWMGGMERSSLDLGKVYELYGADQEAIVLVRDPLPSALGCSIGKAPVDASALAIGVASDPDLDVTDPVAVTVGGFDALSLDVAVAPGADVSCEGGRAVVLAPYGEPDLRVAALGAGAHMRIFLFDMPEGSGLGILAIEVVAPEARFETVMAAATSVLDSIEFPAGSSQSNQP